MSEKIIQFNETVIKDELKELVKTSVEETLNNLLEQEVKKLGSVSQWDLIKKQIDNCDYYIIVVANRYGLLDGDVSYTEK